MLCDDCGRLFGGTYAFDRHLDRRRDRCRTNAELRRRGLHLTNAGIWRQRRPVNPLQPSLFVAPRYRGGSRPLELADVAPVPDGAEAISVGPEGPPLESAGGTS